jgi:hypothetical protein
MSPEMTKGDASRLIEELLERRPPTPRQMMLLRFFDRLDLARATKDDVSEWIDHLYSSDSRLERAWDRFKRLTDHDPRGQDPSIVPVGAFREYVETKMSPALNRIASHCMGLRSLQAPKQAISPSAFFPPLLRDSGSIRQPSPSRL